jgi:hypothetical protein
MSRNMMLLGAMLSIKMPEISGIRSFGTMGSLILKCLPAVRRSSIR